MWEVGYAAILGFSSLLGDDLVVHLLANYNYLLRSCLLMLMASAEC